MRRDTAVVGVLAASPAELSVMQQATAILEKLELPHEIRVMSSSRNPDLVDEYVRTAFDRGLKVLVCTTGITGHLAAAAAARTVLPVIGVPIASDQMGGEQALMVTAQMPAGVPVAAVGVDAAVNAAVLAAEIVGVAEPIPYRNAFLAEAHGIPTRKVMTSGEIHSAVEFARKTPGPVLLDFHVEQEEAVYPMVPTGADLHQMIRRPSPEEKE